MAEKKLTKLEKLLEKKKRLDAQIQQTQAKDKSTEKKRDTRRKILVGAYFLDQAAINKTMKDIEQKMDSYLKKNIDRVLFGLKEIEES